MILKRLKLFTAGLPGTPGYTFSNYDSIMNNNNNAANTNSGGTNVSTTNGASTGTAATNSGTNAASVNNAGGSGAGNASAAANTGANAAKSGSVSVISGTQPVAPFKNANPKVTFDPNNVKFDKDAFNNSRIEGLTQQNSQLQSQLDAANKAKVESAARGRVAGRKQVGVWQGLKNTWNKAGTMKKIGMGGAALAGTYFLGKGLLGGNNNNDQQ